MDAIVIESVSKVFRHRPALLPWRRDKGGQPTVALVNLSLRIPSGTVQVLLGPNGSGKTTLLKLISTMLLPDSGTVLVHGVDTRRREAAVRKLVGFAVVSERSFFPRLTARENLEFFAALDEVPRSVRTGRIRELLAVTGILDHADKLVMNFSSGMYQRLGIARALLKDPSIILLDEPSRSLDPGSAAQLCCLIRELSYRGASLVVATHSFEEALAVGDQVAVLCRGRIARQCRLGADLTPEWMRAIYFDCIGKPQEFDSVLDAHAEDAALAG